MSDEKTGKMKVEPRKMNPISAFLAKRRRQKRKKRFFEAKIGTDKYESFLKEVDNALADMVRKIPDNGLFLDKMGEETAHWLKDLPYINLAAFKAGTCYGVFAYCRMKKEQESKRKQYLV